MPPSTPFQIPHFTKSSLFYCPLHSYYLPGSFAVRCGDHLRFWDHLRSKLGISCGRGSFPASGSFAALYSLSFRSGIVEKNEQATGREHRLPRWNVTWVAFQAKFAPARLFVFSTIPDPKERLLVVIRYAAQFSFLYFLIQWSKFPLLL